MDINQVRFGSYSIGNPKAGSRKSEEKPKENLAQEANENGVKKFNADEVLNAMNLAGLQNRVQINSVAQKEVNPAEFLSDDIIADIEAMMDKFESGVGQVADIIEAEFPNVFPSDQKLALAASIYEAQG